MEADGNFDSSAVCKHAAEERPSLRSESVSVRPPTVLIVDDATATREGLCQLLELRGYATRAAADGRGAIQILREQPTVCLVILDLAMPLHDGYWFREQQLREPALARIPVVVFTGMAHDTVIKSLNGVTVLTKPVAVDQLLAMVTQHCGEAQPTGI